MSSATEQTVSLPNANVQKLNHPVLVEHGVDVDVLRLDKIHPVISGNKFFKLRFFIEEALQYNREIVTFGGPWSNHLHATAYSCYRLKIPCTGLVRGERPEQLSATLADCETFGMKLEFISRQSYRDRLIPATLQHNVVIVPEGGASRNGIKGASTIPDLLDPASYTEILCSVGTGTMMAGLLQHPSAKVRGIMALKIPDGSNTIQHFLEDQGIHRNYVLDHRFHFGGYGKHPLNLIMFMNEFYSLTGIPTDLVYTSKLFYGLIEIIKEGTIKAGSKICVVHSGGLQGNRSLPAGTLVY